MALALAEAGADIILVQVRGATTRIKSLYGREDADADADAAE